MSEEQFCKESIQRMLKNSQTKVIAPVITGAAEGASSHRKTHFSDREIRAAYLSAVKEMKLYLGHDVHIGAKYYDAYGSRMSRYGVLEQVAH